LVDDPLGVGALGLAGDADALVADPYDGGMARLEIGRGLGVGLGCAVGERRLVLSGGGDLRVLDALALRGRISVLVTVARERAAREHPRRRGPGTDRGRSD